MNTDKNVKTLGAIGVFICAHFSIPHSEFRNPNLLHSVDPGCALIGPEPNPILILSGAENAVARQSVSRSEGIPLALRNFENTHPVIPADEHLSLNHRKGVNPPALQGIGGFNRLPSIGGRIIFVKGSPDASRPDPIAHPG
jgi:hypothetical protein